MLRERLPAAGNRLRTESYEKWNQNIPHRPERREFKDRLFWMCASAATDGWETWT